MKSYEAARGYEPHPIGMSMQFPVADQTKVNEPLLDSRADWIAPGFDDERFAHGGHPMAPGAEPSRWYVDPPPNDGRKVVISDTDHYTQGGDALWAWKTFLRGNHPILMDYGLIGGLEPDATPQEGVPPFGFYEPARFAMGDTRRYAERVGLIDMLPSLVVASTRYALVNPMTMTGTPARTAMPKAPPSVPPMTARIERDGRDIDLAARSQDRKALTALLPPRQPATAWGSRCQRPQGGHGETTRERTRHRPARASVTLDKRLVVSDVRSYDARYGQSSRPSVGCERDRS